MTGVLIIKLLKWFCVIRKTFAVDANEQQSLSSRTNNLKKPKNTHQDISPSVHQGKLALRTHA